MGIKLKIVGTSDEIVLENDEIISARYISDTPNNSTSRATDLSVGLELVGKISNEQEDISKKLANWSLIPASSNEAYKSINLEIVSAGIVIRKIVLPNAFVIDYNESYDEKNGTGLFTLFVKQKKEKINFITIEGGYGA